jgi:FHA domain
MVIMCPKCNELVDSSDGFCENCGFKIENISSSDSSPTSQEKQQQEQQEQEQKPPQQSASLSLSADKIKKVCKNKLCSNYEVEYGIDENYCGICGVELTVVKPAIYGEPPESEKRGFLIMPDKSEIEITPTQKLIGRIDLSKYLSEEDLNHVSRGHMTIFKEGEKFFVQDDKTKVQEKQSKNKTCLISGGQQKEEITGKGRRELKHGDQISIADLVTLSFSLR